jgi:hypothetical protein
MIINKEYHGGMKRYDQCNLWGKRDVAGKWFCHNHANKITAEIACATLKDIAERVMDLTDDEVEEVAGELTGAALICLEEIGIQVNLKKKDYKK